MTTTSKSLSSLLYMWDYKIPSSMGGWISIKPWNKVHPGTFTTTWEFFGVGNSKKFCSQPLGTLWGTLGAILKTEEVWTCLEIERTATPRKIDLFHEKGTISTGTCVFQPFIFHVKYGSFCGSMNWCSTRRAGGFKIEAWWDETMNNGWKVCRHVQTFIYEK